MMSGPACATASRDRRSQTRKVLWAPKAALPSRAASKVREKRPPGSPQTTSLLLPPTRHLVGQALDLVLHQRVVGELARHVLHQRQREPRLLLPDVDQREEDLRERRVVPSLLDHLFQVLDRLLLAPLDLVETDEQAEEPVEIADHVLHRA